MKNEFDLHYWNRVRDLVLRLEERMKEMEDALKIQAAVDNCCSFDEFDEGCYHCRQKQTLVNLACAWAFDLGMYA